MSRRGLFMLLAGIFRSRPCNTWAQQKLRAWPLVGVILLLAIAGLALAQTSTIINMIGVNQSGTIAIEQIMIISGSTPLPTTAITAGTCSLVSITATGLASSDVIIATFNADPTMVTGYLNSLSVYSFPSTNAVNFEVCNISASAVTPGPISLNWKVFK